MHSLTRLDLYFTKDIAISLCAQKSTCTVMEDDSPTLSSNNLEEKENVPGEVISLKQTVQSESTSVCKKMPDPDGQGTTKPFGQTISSFSGSRGKKKPLQTQTSLGRTIKCVLIGDSKTGKSALIQSFLDGQNISNYVPTTEDIYVHPIKKSENNKTKNGNEDTNVTLLLCDTGGQQDMDRLRPLCYSQAQIVIICFSVMNPTSFANVTLKWLPEVKRHCKVTEDPNNPLKLLLVGTQSDLRSNVNMLIKLMDDGLAPVNETQALRLANKIGALKYVESSCVTQANVRHIFDLVMTYGNGRVLPKQVAGVDVDTSFPGKILPNITERKLLFWRRWRLKQNKSSKMKRLVFLPCLF